MTFADPVPECWARIDIPSLLGSAGSKCQHVFIRQLQNQLGSLRPGEPQNPNFLLPLTSTPFSRSSKNQPKSSRATLWLSHSYSKVSSHTVIHSLHSMTFLSVPTQDVKKLHWHCLIQSFSPSLSGAPLLPLVNCLPGDFNINVPVMILFGMCRSIRAANLRTQSTGENLRLFGLALARMTN